MLEGWPVVFAALIYLAILFAVAHIGNKRGAALMKGAWRPLIFALTLGVYCTSWTFLGSVGLASRSGYDFLPIYVGPVIVFIFFWPFLMRVVRLARAENITSVADFIAARYGKSELVAAVVVIIAIIGVVPYISLQLKAVSSALEIILSRSNTQEFGVTQLPFFGDLSLYVSLIMAAFAIVFGAGQIDATRPQDGLMLAIATESVVKLVAFLAVGFYVVFSMFGGLGDLYFQASTVARAAIFSTPPDWRYALVVTLISAPTIMLLPRQFHVTVIENRNSNDLRQAAWMFPAYIVLINLFVVPITWAGLIVFSNGAIDRDLTVLALPIAGGSRLITLIAFIGALSAATAMVIVECVALAVMVSNNLIIPLLLRRGVSRMNDANVSLSARLPDMAGKVLLVRRGVIIVIMLLGYGYYKSLGGREALASIGLSAFAAIAQIAPAFIGGMVWKRATASGAVAGMLVGITVWFFTLMLPNLVKPGDLFYSVLEHGYFDIPWLKPGQLLGAPMPLLVESVVISLLLNTLAFIGVSYLRPVSPIERLQANIFVGSGAMAEAQSMRLWSSAISLIELKRTIARYLGAGRTEQAFADFETSRGDTHFETMEADAHTLRFAEHLLASVIGTASSRLVLSMMLKRRSLTTEAALKLLDDASAAIQYSRDSLQHALDHTEQGVTFFDSNLQLICWNRAFQDLFEFPERLVRFGTSLDEIKQFARERSDKEIRLGRAGIDAATGGENGKSEQGRRAATEVDFTLESSRLRLYPSRRVLEIRSNHLPSGGVVTTYTDITEAVAAERALEQARQTLEKRVTERTEELLKVNRELAHAKSHAEEASQSKTRFLAAASHDILQPLNAARLYATSLAERSHATNDAALALNVESALDAVEEILTTLLEISRFDAGDFKPEITTFRIDDFFRQLSLEFTPIAEAKGLRLAFAPSSLAVVSDRRLLRRILQNFISNAVKYTPKGKVLVGAKRAGNNIRFMVLDTGLGIPESQQKLIFDEFRRLDQGMRVASGLGLGLSIVERMARVLGHSIGLRSIANKGSSFSLHVPRGKAGAKILVEAENLRLPLAPLVGLVVLAIDNEPSILAGMRSLLENWGCVVFTAESYAEAEIILQNDGAQKTNAHIDVLIVDYHLNAETGIEVISALRKDLQIETPAFLITAERAQEMRDQAAEHGITVMNKPLRPAALRVALAQIKLAKG